MTVRECPVAPVRNRRALPWLSAFVISIAGPTHASAQWQGIVGPQSAGFGAPVATDVERYLHALSLSSLSASVPRAARPYRAGDVHEMLGRSATTAHPWGQLMTARASQRAAIGASALASYNTGFPWGANDGPIWQGRGATGAVGAAATVRVGPLTLTAAPVIYAAQNRAYPLAVTPGFDSVMSAVYPYDIDLPQRFGTSTYSGWSPGESSADLALGPFRLGVSTASEGWGPGESFPPILGANAGGFPHLYVGTKATGMRVPSVGVISARYMLGTLSQSRWSPVTGPDSFASIAFPGTRRVAVGAVASLTPAFLRQVEVGATRFYHAPWREDGRAWRSWSKPFEGILKSGFGDRGEVYFDPTGDIGNQLASLFARWSFPSRGAELSFEYFREDHNYDTRDLASEPEQNGATMASVRVLTHRKPTALAALTLEYFAGDVRPIAQQRSQGLLYFHGTLRQGHTVNGQLLGSPIGPGAVDGQRAAWERFTPNGSMRFVLQRLRTRSRTSSDPEGLFRAPGTFDRDAHDWIIDGSASLSRFTSYGSTSIEAGIASAQVWQLSDSRLNAYLRFGLTAF